MTQPPLTQAIRQLEGRLGVVLFERTLQGMIPTAAGAALADEARAVLARLERAERRTREIGAGGRPLRIGFVSAALNEALPRMLRGLMANGESAPELAEMTTPEQLNGLADGRIDVGLLHPPIPREPDLLALSLGRDPFWAALPRDHPLVAFEQVTFAQIAHEPFVLFPEAQGPSLHGAIRRAAFDAGQELRIVAEASRVHSQLALVAGGLGVGLVTRSTARALTFEGVATRPIADTADRLYMELSLAAAPDLAQRLFPLIA